MRCKVPLVLIDLQCCKDESDENGGSKPADKCLTKEYEIESRGMSFVGWFDRRNRII